MTDDYSFEKTQNDEIPLPPTHADVNPNRKEDEKPLPRAFRYQEIFYVPDDVLVHDLSKIFSEKVSNISRLRNAEKLMEKYKLTDDLYVRFLRLLDKKEDLSNKDLLTRAKGLMQQAITRTFILRNLGHDPENPILGNQNVILNYLRMPKIASEYLDSLRADLNNSELSLEEREEAYKKGQAWVEYYFVNGLEGLMRLYSGRTHTAELDTLLYDQDEKLEALQEAEKTREQDDFFLLGLEALDMMKRFTEKPYGHEAYKKYKVMYPHAEDVKCPVRQDVWQKVGLVACPDVLEFIDEVYEEFELEKTYDPEHRYNAAKHAIALFVPRRIAEYETKIQNAETPKLRDEILRKKKNLQRNRKNIENLIDKELFEEVPQSAEAMKKKYRAWSTRQIGRLGRYAGNFAENPRKAVEYCAFWREFMLLLVTRGEGQAEVSHKQIQVMEELLKRQLGLSISEEDLKNLDTLNTETVIPDKPHEWERFTIKKMRFRSKSVTSRMMKKLTNIRKGKESEQTDLAASIIIVKNKNDVKNAKRWVESIFGALDLDKDWNLYKEGECLQCNLGLTGEHTGEIQIMTQEMYDKNYREGRKGHGMYKYKAILQKLEHDYGSWGGVSMEQGKHTKKNLIASLHTQEGQETTTKETRDFIMKNEEEVQAYNARRNKKENSPRRITMIDSVGAKAFFKRKDSEKFLSYDLTAFYYNQDKKNKKEGNTTAPSPRFVHTYYNGNERHKVPKTREMTYFDVMCEALGNESRGNPIISWIDEQGWKNILEHGELPTITPARAEQIQFIYNGYQEKYKKYKKFVLNPYKPSYTKPSELKEAGLSEAQFSVLASVLRFLTDKDTFLKFDKQTDQVQADVYPGLQKLYDVYQKVSKTDNVKASLQTDKDSLDYWEEKGAQELMIGHFPLWDLNQQYIDAKSTINSMKSERDF